MPMFIQDKHYFDDWTAEERGEERREANPFACRCGNPDWPGRCPGWRWCPLQQQEDEE